MQIITGIVTFLIWTLILYSIHRLAHTDYFPLLNKLHQDHHMTIDENRELGPVWSNIFLYSDSWRSTVDMWVSEVIPTLLFCLISGFWWIFGVYYIWTAFIQERIEHDKNFNLYPWFTSGKWHMIHHKNSEYNFGLFFPIWDIFFSTNKPIRR